MTKSHMLKQNNNNETSPQSGAHMTPKLSLASTTTVDEAVKNGRVAAAKPDGPQPTAQPSPALTTQVCLSCPFSYISLQTFGRHLHFC